jgi:molybdate transport system substrate-binding protein
MASQSIKALTAGATSEGLNLCAVPFTAQTGIMIEPHTNHGHIIEQEIIAGNVDDDIVLLPTAMIDELAKNKLVDSSTRTAIGTIRIGAAVREGVPTPDVSTLKSVTQTLFSAKSIILIEALRGVHMDRVITELGLGHKLADRITQYDTGTMVNEHLSTSRAKAEIAFGVATEIIFSGTRASAMPVRYQMKCKWRSITKRLC